MNLYCIKCSMFTQNNIKIKPEINVKINFYSRCHDCGFKKFETIVKEVLSGLLKV